MQGEKSTYNLNDFAKKRKNSNSDKSHPFVYAEPLDLIFSLSWKTKQWLSDFNESRKEKKSPGRSSITEFYLLAWLCNIWAGIITTPAQSAQYGKTEVIRYIHVLVYLFNARKI